MRSRLLLDPTSVDGGVADPITTPEPAPKVVIPAIDPAEWEQERAELARLRTAESDRARAEKDRNEKTLADKGKWEEIIQARDKALADTRAEMAAEIAKRDKASAEQDSSIKGFVLTTEIATALNGRTDLSQGAAPKLARLLREDFEAKKVGGEWKVATRDGKSVADHINAYLESPENALFLKATARGGAGSDGSVAAVQSGVQAQPTALQKAAANMKAQKDAWGGRGMNFPVASKN